jgi:hypothetical protein
VTSPVHLRPRSIPELVDAAVPLLRRQYLLLVMASAVLLAPVLVLELVLPPNAAWVASIASNLLYVMIDAATIWIVSESYLGNVPDLASTLRTLGSRSASLLGATFLRGLLVLVGFVVLVLPGIVFYAWSFAMPMVVMLEGRRAGEAYSRSNELVRGNTARVLLALFLAFAVMMLIVLAFGMAAGMLIEAVGLPARTADLIGKLAIIFFYPIGGVVGTLLYYDLRIRKDGFDLEVMARELAA